MSGAHTPGSGWYIAPDNGIYLDVDGKTIYLGKQYGSDVPLLYPEVLKQARYEISKDRTIRAAAPDLLAALENLLAVHEGEGGTMYHAGDIARAAIAKAKGV